ncbi:precorrin-8X methylmutase [Hippea maritima]|uniref:Precorrin-8X methylmutase n=1 Tax=Hippea maritima (strain ATCC 700847 / DSM 10411 / MH2) TaxID=760142 RepID=F2LU97_HIPMA|nr:precorrin-8X methylmutase [Hippea maritima]AEA34560.1 Precorrin-8X methylmutase [Hippea maritima DSM 10411]
MKGKDIEQKSFEIIEANVDLTGFDEKQRVIVKRIIHASGDFEFAQLIKFSEDAVERGIVALKNCYSVVCDVNMVKAGITEAFASRIGVKLHCFINDDDVVRRSKTENKTRAECSILKANEMFEKIIFVIGNSPTALLEVLRLNDTGRLKPSFVLGFPVGFVDAESSKKLLMQSDLPYITNIGTKGGSPIAASAFRAIAGLAFDL